MARLISSKAQLVQIIDVNDDHYQVTSNDHRRPVAVMTIVITHTGFTWSADLHGVYVKNDNTRSNQWVRVNYRSIAGGVPEWLRLLVDQYAPEWPTSGGQHA